MPSSCFRAALLALPAAIGGLISAPAPAQMPIGSAVVGTFYDPTTPGTPGLYLLPLAGGPTFPVTGLPPALRVTSGNAQQGVATVAVRPLDGAIVVGTTAVAGGPTAGAVELYLLHLNGTAVTQTQQILLGTTTNAGGAFVTPMPDGDRILVMAGQQNGPLPAGPMANHFLAIVDVSGPAPVFQLLPNPPVANGFGGGFAFDPSGDIVYFLVTTNIGSPSRVAELHMLSIASNQHSVIASWPGQFAAGIACDDDRRVYVSAADGNSPAHYMHTALPNGFGSPATVTTQQSSSPLPPSGLALDRASHRFLVAGAGYAPGYGNLNTLSLVDPTTGTAITMPQPAGGWGAMGRIGVAVHNAIESYGASSSFTSNHWFENFPNPGGQPTLGNAGFSLTMRTGAGPYQPILSMLALALGAGSTQVGGVEILVDPGSTTTAFVAPAPSVTFALPLPNSVTLAGMSIYAQSLHLDPWIWTGMAFPASSRGLVFKLH